MVTTHKAVLQTTENYAGERDFVDMDTIRRRLAKIKNRWSPEMVRARALEGTRRRAELEALLGGKTDESGLLKA